MSDLTYLEYNMVLEPRKTKITYYWYNAEIQRIPEANIWCWNTLLYKVEGEHLKSAWATNMRRRRCLHQSWTWLLSRVPSYMPPRRSISTWHLDRI